VVVPFAAYEAGAGWPWIIAFGAVAYLLVLAVELFLWRQSAQPRVRTTRAPTPRAIEEPPADDEHVRVFQTEPEPAFEPEPAPSNNLVQAEISPAPEPATPHLVSVPEPEPEPVAVHAAAPEPAPPPAVVPIGLSAAPRQWNVWDLEQLARENAGGDPIADEERTFLLMYLRDFAGADGLLPVDFDDLVRQSFGGLVSGR